VDWKKQIYLWLLSTFFVLSTIFSLRAGRIEKAFESIERQDYFKAKILFSKSLKTQGAISSYGLAIIFHRNNNPFYSLDSAYFYINQAHDLYPFLKKNAVQRFRMYVDQHKIDSVRQIISSSFFALAQQEHSQVAYQRFIDQHAWALEIPQAIFLRDSLAFEQTKILNNSMAYASYVGTYPESDFVDQAHNLLMKAQYAETTAPQTLESYELFVMAFPENPYRKDAETVIYNLVTTPNTIASLEQFLDKYPDNHKRPVAWDRLYNLNMYDYSAESIRKFSKKYPDYPNVEKLKTDLTFIDFPLFPYLKNGKYGFMDSLGVSVIDAIYSSVSPFKEGLALVSIDDKFGYINKNGEVIIDFLYNGGQDFEQGRAIIKRYERLGMIDRTGTTVFEPEFEELDNLSDGLILGMRDKMYAYYDANGKTIIPERFNDAYPFVNERAKVEENGLQAYINTKGEYIVMPAFEEIEFFSESLLIFGNKYTFGLMTIQCQIVVPNKYEKIGKLSEGLAIVVLDGRLGYINEYGKEVISPQFDLIPNYLSRSQFKDGNAVVAKNRNYGIINTLGKEIVPLKNEDIGKWTDLIAVQRKGKWGFINQANRIIIAPQFDFAESFVGHTAIIQEMSLYGVINRASNKIIETAYSNIEHTLNNYFIINNGALYGVANNLGEIIVPMRYRSIRVFDGKLLVLIDQNGISYFDCFTEKILKLQL